MAKQIITLDQTVRVALLSCVLAAACAAQMAYVQSATSTTGSVSLSGVAAGDFLYLTASFYSGSVSCTDSNGTPVEAQSFNSGNGVYATAFYEAGAAAGTHSFSCTGGMVVYTALAAEFSGVSGTIDGTPTTTASLGSGTTLTWAALTVSSGDLVLADGLFNNGFSLSMNSPFGTAYRANGSDGAHVISYYLNASAGSVTPSGTMNGGSTSSSAGLTIAFKPATSSSTAPCTLATLGAGGCTIVGSLDDGSATLPVRQRGVIRFYYYMGLPMREIGRALSRVSQIHAKAINTLRKVKSRCPPHSA